MKTQTQRAGGAGQRVIDRWPAESPTLTQEKWRLVLWPQLRADILYRSHRAAATGCVGTEPSGGRWAYIRTHNRHRGKWKPFLGRSLSTTELLASGCTADDAVRVREVGEA